MGGMAQGQGKSNGISRPAHTHTHTHTHITHHTRTPVHKHKIHANVVDARAMISTTLTLALTLTLTCTKVVRHNMEGRKFERVGNCPCISFECSVIVGPCIGGGRAGRVAAEIAGNLAWAHERHVNQRYRTDTLHYRINKRTAWIFEDLSASQ